MTRSAVVLAEAGSDPTWQRALQVAPAIIWPLIVILGLLLFRGKITDKLSDITSVKVAHVEAKFAERLAEVQRSTTAASPAEQRGAVGRATRARPWCAGKRILWVDDKPGTNHRVGELFKQLLEMEVEYELTTDGAMRTLLTDSGFSMVITDMVRGDDREAGITLISRMRSEYVYRPTVIYSFRDSADVGVPAGAFGLTSRTDELLHYVIDICEREWRPR